MISLPDELNLKEMFAVHTYQEWRQVVEKQLKGMPFEKLFKKTYEDIKIQPIYFQTDIEGLEHLKTTNAIEASWAVAQEIQCSDPEEFNRCAHLALSHGQTILNIVIDPETSAGLTSRMDVARAFDNIALDTTPVMIVCMDPQALTTLLAEQSTDLKGCIGFDPLGTLALKGSLPFALETVYDRIAGQTRWALSNAPELKTVFVDVSPAHDAGASSVQELAWAAAAGTEYIRVLQEHGLAPHEIAGHLLFSFSVGSDFFMEIAKLRALRLIWDNITTAFSCQTPCRVHVRTSQRNKTSGDPSINMLRVTTEALSAVCGGCDSLHVSPFDESVGPDQFSARIARNVQIILKEESHINKVKDPSAGSWYLENLTDSLARKAWELFQEIESQGGLYAALQKGMLQEKIAATAKERADDLAMRKNILVGANKYINPEENLTDSPVITPLKIKRMAAPFEDLRQKNHNPKVFLANMGTIPRHKPRADFAVDFFQTGGFKVINNNGFENVSVAVQAAKNSGAQVVVICSSDDFYPEVVPQLTAELKKDTNMTVIVAGYPKKYIDAFKTAGVDDFIHRHCNALKIMQDLHKRLGGEK